VIVVILYNNVCYNLILILTYDNILEIIIIKYIVIIYNEYFYYNNGIDNNIINFLH
jgi:hypothetical protein